jgi:ribosomal protein S18 acetylase RimI-like enzyme
MAEGAGPPELRPARAADAPLLAEVLEMAARGHLPRGPWDFLFPADAERRAVLEALATGDPCWCHHSVFIVAERAGEPAAALAAFEPRAIGGTELAQPLARALGRLARPAERLAGGAGAMAAYLRCFPEMPEGVWIVENVGARAAHRRRGLVGALLGEALAEGRRRGLDRAQISCLIGNAPALGAYTKAGFRAVEERKDPAFEALLGAPGFLRLVRDL